MKLYPTLILGIVTLLAGVSPAAADQDYQGQPAPPSADQLVTSFDREFEGEETPEHTALDEILDNSKVLFKLRNYYLSRTRPENSDPLAWAQGGSLEYKVDKVGGVFGLTVEQFGSYKLDAPPDRDGTLLLGPGQDDINVLGVANPRLNLNGHIVSAYRQKFDLPYVNSQDNRMIPNTFEGYVIGMPKTENEKFQYLLGYISEIKKRNGASYRSMSEAAGVDGSKERGMIAAGARYFIVPELSLSAINYFVDDVLNISYAETVHKVKFNEDWANSFSVQYSDQRSVGDDLLRDEEYSTFFWGAQEALSYKNATAKFAFTFDDTGGDLRSPYGSYPGYNSGIFDDFNRAGEKAWQVGLAYNFARFNLKGVGISAGYIHAVDAIDEDTKESLPDKEETDVTLDLKHDEGIFKGFWLRMRSALVHEEGKGTTEDYRIILNYEIPLYG